MPSFRKPIMSKVNGAMSSMKSANNRLQQEASRAILDLKCLEQRAIFAQRQVRSSRPSVISAESNADHVQDLLDALYYREVPEHTHKPTSVDGRAPPQYVD